jgi:GT2 family glycosyltransferase
MIRRSLFSKAGGFDEDFGMGTYEDVSLCLQVRTLGSRIWVETSAIAYHYVGATVEKNQQGFPLEINKSIFRAKWGSTGLFVIDNWSYF